MEATGPHQAFVPQLKTSAQQHAADETVTHYRIEGNSNDGLIHLHGPYTYHGCAIYHNHYAYIFYLVVDRAVEGSPSTYHLPMNELWRVRDDIPGTETSGLHDEKKRILEFMLHYGSPVQQQHLTRSILDYMHASVWTSPAEHGDNTLEFIIEQATRDDTLLNNILKYIYRERDGAASHVPIFVDASYASPGAGGGARGSPSISPLRL